MAATLTQVWEAICSHTATRTGLQVWALAEPNMGLPALIVPPLPASGLERGTFGGNFYWRGRGGGPAVWTLTLVVSADLLKAAAGTLLMFSDPTSERSVWSAFDPDDGDEHQTLGGVVDSCAVLSVSDQRAVEVDDQLLGWGFDFELAVQAQRRS